MRIGVVCEGPTDFVAIQSFIGHALEDKVLTPEFIAIQPTMDNTSPKAGWGNVLLWLNSNPPASRISRYFGGGLFADDLAFEPLDCFLIQIDTDVIENASFVNFARNTYGIAVVAREQPEDRAQQIERVLTAALRNNEMTDADIRRHVAALAVESTEAWCVAAHKATGENTETMKGQDLTDSFMSALALSEGRPATPPYGTINKEIDRRQRLCDSLRARSARVCRSCTHFNRAVTALLAI